MDNKKRIIEQTAQDYDMPCEIVAYYYDNFYEQFYEKLEEYIKLRSKIN